MVVRTLITTADNTTWPKDDNCPLLFLGEWCKRYTKRSEWEKLDAIVAPYHWDNRKKFFSDYKYLNGLYEQLLVELSNKLNQIHSVQYSLRYWRILIGPWLGYFIQILFDRWFMLNQAVSQNNISQCLILGRDFDSVVPNDMEQFVEFMVQDDWNEAIYSQLLQMCWKDQINLIEFRNKDKVVIIDKKINTSLRDNFRKLMNFYNKLFTKDEGYFFISSYLPINTEFSLQLRLGQLPIFHKSPVTPNSNPKISEREWRLEITDNNTKSFETILRLMIPQHIPTSYLEGYKDLVCLTKKVYWPTKPKAIFTSISYSSDDVFKAWAAKKTENGTPLLIAQHGGHFGMSLFSFHEEHQIEIADRWISWGWDDQKRTQIIPFGNTKNINRNIKHEPTGGALMVDMAISRYSNHMSAFPTSSQWLDYFVEQKRFLKALPIELRKQVVVRLKGDYGWDQLDRWRDQFPEVVIDKGHKRITEQIRKNRLYIATYNATVYLDSFVWNIPTLIFWKPEHWEINDNSMPYFDILKSAGILHDTPESAARKMALVWDNIDTWWYSNKVQRARRQFCQKFSKVSDDSLNELRNIIQKASKDKKYNKS